MEGDGQLHDQYRVHSHDERGSTIIVVVVVVDFELGRGGSRQGLLVVVTVCCSCAEQRQQQQQRQLWQQSRHSRWEGAARCVPRGAALPMGHCASSFSQASRKVCDRLRCSRCNAAVIRVPGKPGPPTRTTCGCVALSLRGEARGRCTPRPLPRPTRASARAPPSAAAGTSHAHGQEGAPLVLLGTLG